ncbi:DUF5054 domain-containing protein [Iamia sp.]|uniref:DUF5054 domain-containing protein n=1 Tax=Iamia sp. TaxID=2722710 RepID=UPI002BB37EB4|nr:DUF5054 domain-containing protein [Iamia sp.]HXH56885.1 DUF5054 domain-containing protein [Iamia sp.]
MSDRPTVHLVAKTHLDVGFTALASEVVDTYVERYIPAALALGAELRSRGGPERFVWTTGSWLVHTFLERTHAVGRAAAEAAIEAGDLAWHALPFTTHTELCDAPLIEAGLALSARLDHRFDRRTVAAKLTDVPGHTRGLVPLLAAAGVELLHVGVNPVATVPDVPPCFRWRSPDGSEVTVVYQAGGYGDLTEVPGSPHRLAFAHAGDNLGPPGVDEVLAGFASWRDRVPGAQVRGSTLDAFAETIRPVVAELPVVTAEIGDTWVHGVGSDPQKVAAYRELLRVRRSWLAAGMVAPDDSRLRGFHENLLLVAEHTWGLDEKTHLPDRERWSRATLPALRAEPRTQAYEASWAEQRAYVDAAVAAIESDGLRRAAGAALSALRSPVPAWGAGDEVPADRPTTVGCWEIEIDPVTGAITHLVDRVSGRALADADHPVALLAHQAFSGADYDRYLGAYVHALPDDEWWAVQDNTKPGIDAAGATSAWWEPEAAGVHLGERWSSRRGAGRVAASDEAAGGGGASGAVVGPGEGASDEAVGLGGGGAESAVAGSGGGGAGSAVVGPGEGASGADPGTAGDFGLGGAGEGRAEQRAVEALVVRLRLPAEAATRSGAPAEATLYLSDVSPPEGPSTLSLELRWGDKPANRLPEATWLGVRPLVERPGTMVLDKLGQDVSPLDVVPGGGQHLHAVGEGVRWPSPEGTLALRTLDAPLIAPGRPRLLDPAARPPDLAEGIWIALHDNVWGTNFPMWSEGPARFRFTLSWDPAPIPPSTPIRFDPEPF